MLRFNKTINNGPPTIAIIIADEISYGAMITLPRVSALNNVIAPSNIQIGILQQLHLYCTIILQVKTNQNDTNSH